VIALYFERIAAVMSSPLSGFVQMLRAERVSRTVYDSLLNDHLRSNEPVLNALPRALHVQLPRDKSVVVAGAGPSLEECAPALRRWRRQLMVIAASGAVPPLRAAGIDPDWVIALEARETVLDDLADLPQGISVVVFASAHPQVIQRIRGPLYCGAGLDSRGGTTLIPALDFALQCSPCDVFLVGADLGHGSRTYAAGAKRDTARSNLLPGMSPKFLAMRAALENLLERRANESRVVYHVLTAAPTLRGTQHMVPAELDAAWKTSVMTREIR